MVILRPDTPQPHDSEGSVARRTLVLAGPGDGALVKRAGRRVGEARPGVGSVRPRQAASGRHRTVTPAPAPSARGDWCAMAHSSVVVVVVAAFLVVASLSLFAAFGAGGVAPLVALVVAHQGLCGRRHGRRGRSRAPRVSGVGE
ncbi:hypothetical protein ACFFQW_35420 [Umezawaea endophytica]|uniref:Uncharacterized protein n=1 Tax=Umezawaea endophytica TaxID=1654476 RepID=A0A9X2ZZB3_9PSEU|nr:hypothetical protein [Umezawaea endophytica]MCS7475693.1 hypothetical protein [Umezawaea endophytica]